MYDVIIYGIGALGEKNLNIIRCRLSDRYKVIGYMDSFYQKEFYQYKKVFKIEELQEIYYDYIVINAYNQFTDNEIYSLLREHGVQHQKIIRYAKYTFCSYEFPIRPIANKIEVLRNMTEVPKFEGVLVGMSYAENGIDINQLSGCIYNLAHPAFDLFYRKLTIEALFLEKVKLEKLRYIIFELPYYIFNFDLSLCGNGLFQSSMNYIDYWKDWHHFDENEENREFLMGFHIFKDMFLKDSVGNFSMVENRRSMSDNQLTKKKMGDHVISHTIKKCHEKTMKENRYIFHEILKTVAEKFLNVKLIILVCPQPSVNIALYEKYPLQKQVFCEEMKLAQEMYPDLIILDNHELFLEHDEYFADTYGHLNRNGCDIFTRHLDQELAFRGIY